MKREGENTDTKASAGRDREATEKRLLDTVGAMIDEAGCEKIGVNAVAARAGVSKVLIYRYFGSAEGLMAAYVRRHDFWINFPDDIPGKEELPVFLKDMFRRQARMLLGNTALRRLCRWELSSDNELVAELRQRRERAGLGLIERVSALTGKPADELAGLATLVSSSITYIAMLGEFCRFYNGIDIGSEEGMEAVCRAADTVIDRIFAEPGTQGSRRPGTGAFPGKP